MWLRSASGLLFPGQYFDSETGLHYNYFRTYDPSIGRYITDDPIGLAGGLNTYTYAYQNPTNYIDPDGREVVTIAACAAAAGGAAAIISTKNLTGSDQYKQLKKQLDWLLENIDDRIAECSELQKKAELYKLRNEVISALADLTKSEFGDDTGMTLDGIAQEVVLGATCAALLVIPGL